MIHYVLGHSGAGKTRLCLWNFERAEKALFFCFFPEDPYDWEKLYTEKYPVLRLTDSVAEKSLISLNSVDPLERFSLVYERVVEAKEKGFKTIFIDEFQSVRTQKLIDFILENEKEIDFWIIHQWPGQIEAPFFNVLYEKAGKKYLLDPYPKEDGYFA